MDLFLTDEVLVEKRCNIWLINNPEIAKPVYKNEQKLNAKKVVLEEEKKVQNEGDDDSSDIVIMGDKDEESEIELIEVKKVENGDDELKKKIKEL